MDALSPPPRQLLDQTHLLLRASLRSALPTSATNSTPLWSVLLGEATTWPSSFGLDRVYGGKKHDVMRTAAKVPRLPKSCLDF
jgi:hypothetical protein